MRRPWRLIRGAQRVFEELQEKEYVQYHDLSLQARQVIRLEHVEVDGSEIAGVDGDSIRGITVGLNWFLNGKVHFQLNYIGEYLNGAGNAPSARPKKCAVLPKGCVADSRDTRQN